MNCLNCNTKLHYTIKYSGGNMCKKCRLQKEEEEKKNNLLNNNDIHVWNQNDFNNNYFCMICGKSKFLSLNGFSNHLNKIHNKTFKDYIFSSVSI